MINAIPETWTYNKDMEMLYLFYQLSDELLSEYSVDTYSLPLHNTFTLIQEIQFVYDLINEYNIVKEYYCKYIPHIVDEIVFSLEDDCILKKELGERLESIKTGLIEAKENPSVLQRWIGIIYQCCTFKKYTDLLKKEIIYLITKTNEKQKLIKITKDYYVCLINSGYTREFLYQTVKKFFSNKKESIFINSVEQIDNFLSRFSCERKEMEFLFLMNITTIDYINNLSDKIQLSEKIQKVDSRVLLQEFKDTDFMVTELLKEFDEKSKEKGEIISIVRLKAKCIDYFDVVKDFNGFIDYQLAINSYFKHFYKTKQVFKIIARNENGKFFEIKAKSDLTKRPYIKQDKIDVRFENVLMSNSMSQEANNSLTNAMIMHDESINIRISGLMLRNFWTALETLFLQPSSNERKENVINSTLSIIQKTYILKLLRNIYASLVSYYSADLKKIGIVNFDEFIVFFSSNNADSDTMKKLYCILENNPLLRSRIHKLRTDLKNGKSVSNYLENHQKRILWQLERIYRYRNVATHMGKELPCTHIVVNHLHNYFDFVINYLLCKSENNDYIDSISNVVFECRNDNRIHHELLKKFNDLSCDNYNLFLFGPDKKIIDYEFETV